MMELESLQQELRSLPKTERLKLAHWLLDSLVEPTIATTNPLLAWAGLFDGGPGNTAEQAEAILEAEIDRKGGGGGS